MEALPLPSPFLRSWWLQHTAGERPVFVLMVEGRDLIGGLALDEDRMLGVPRLRLQGAGALCPDHLDLVAAPGREAEVIEAIASWLSLKGSTVIDLEGLVTNARVRAALPPAVREDTMNVAPWAPAPSDFTEWVSLLSSNLRKTMRTASRRLEEAGVSHKIVADPASAAATLEALRRLHGSRWGRRSRFLCRFDDFAAAAMTGVEKGELVFHELSSAEQVVGVLACFEVAGRASLYQWGFDPDPRWGGLGSVLLTRVFERSCALRLAEVDFLRGSEPYKQRFAPYARQVVRLRAAQGLPARLVLIVLLLEDLVRKLGRFTRRHIRERIKRS